jgi:hypothetical protein
VPSPIAACLPTSTRTCGRCRGDGVVLGFTRPRSKGTSTVSSSARSSACPSWPCLAGRAVERPSLCSAARGGVRRSHSRFRGNVARNCVERFRRNRTLSSH